jgi:hypothetical protein
MSHDQDARITQLRETLTQRRYNPVVVDKYCRSARHFSAIWRGGRSTSRPCRPTFRIICASRFVGFAAPRLSSQVGLDDHAAVGSPCTIATRSICSPGGDCPDRDPRRLPAVTKYEFDMSRWAYQSGPSRKEPRIPGLIWAMPIPRLVPARSCPSRAEAEHSASVIVES